MLTGEKFDAEEARSMGLVTHVCDDTQAVVETLCAGILKGAPQAIAATKELLHSVPGLDRDEAFETMRLLSEEFFSSPDAAEGMQAFAEKREPVWGRA
jgi:enoyl-CoA hydratase/carnithine racemase